MTGAVDERRRPRAAFDGSVLAPGYRLDGHVLLSPAHDGAAAHAAARGLTSRERIDAFRARWVKTQADIGGRPFEARERLMALLRERIGEVVDDVENGSSAALADSLGEALALVDALDDELSQIEIWLNAVAAQAGVFCGGEREKHRLALGLPATEDLTLTDGRHG